MSDEFEINWSEKSARIAAVYGFASGLIFYLLYVNEVMQIDYISRADEYFISLIPAAVAGGLGFFSGMTIFKSGNFSGHFFVPALMIVYIFLWSDERGDDLGEALFHGAYLLVNTAIIFVIFIIIGLVRQWVRQGK